MVRQQIRKTAASMVMVFMAVSVMMGCQRTTQTETTMAAESTANETELQVAETTVAPNTATEQGTESQEDMAEMTIPERIKKAIEDSGNPTGAVRVTEDEEHYIFDLGESVERTHVYYKTRYGIELAGDLYVSKDADLTQKHPAIVVGPPFGGVKEQGPGVYANELAQRGFVVLTFDPSYHGYSGGLPRQTVSTDIYTEDFSAGVDYLGLLDYVDREAIGAIGICGSGGFSLAAAAQDTRIKAVAASAMYDITGMGASMAGEARDNMIAGMCEQRYADAENGYAAFNPSYPADAPLAELPEGLEGINVEWQTFYSLERGWHPNAYAGATNTSMLSMMNFAALTHIQDISPRPILFITGDIAHSRSMSEEFYERAAEPKELYIVEGAMHIDLYDDVEKIPFDKLESFFMEAFE